MFSELMLLNIIIMMLFRALQAARKIHNFEMSKQLLNFIPATHICPTSTRSIHEMTEIPHRKMPLRTDSFVRDHNTQSTHRIDLN